MAQRQTGIDAPVNVVMPKNCNLSKCPMHVFATDD